MPVMLYGRMKKPGQSRRANRSPWLRRIWSRRRTCNMLQRELWPNTCRSSCIHCVRKIFQL